MSAAVLEVPSPSGSLSPASPQSLSLLALTHIRLGENPLSTETNLSTLPFFEPTQMPDAKS